MRILVVASKYPPEYAGAGYRIHNTYKRLKKIYPELEWSVLCSSVEFKNTEHYQYEGINVTRIGAGNWRVNGNSWNKRFVDALVAYREAFVGWNFFNTEVDIVHVFGSSGLTAAAIMWAQFNKIPLLTELVTNKASPQQTLPGLARFWKPSVTGRIAIIAISETLANVSEQLGFKGKVWSRPNPIDENRFFPAFEQRKVLRNEITPFDVNDIVLVAVAKFMPQKNQLFLIDVLARLPEHFKLVLVGPMVETGPLFSRDQAYMNDIHQRIAHLNLEKRVYIKTGFADMADHVKLSDVYLLPNTNEGLGTPMLESLACGVPVIANQDEAAFRQWIRQDKDGLLVNLDAPLWADAIKEVLTYKQSQLEEASKRVLALAGTKMIDDVFYKILLGLLKTRAGKNFQMPNKG